MAATTTRTQQQQQQQPAAAAEINLITLNCWGLKYLSAHRTARLRAIGDQLATAHPQPDLVALQECWTQGDFGAIRARTQHLLPHAKFYHSGILGAGLVVLSRWPIVASSMHAYALNGRPTAFFRGDWFVGKGVACATVRVPPGVLGADATLIELLNTHLHAPYEPEPSDSYLCHRTAQAWELAKLLRAAAQRGRLALAAGDFNMLPDSLAHQIVATHGAARDAWRAAHPAAPDTAKPAHTVGENIARNGTTCDSAACTWRWPAHQQRRLAAVTSSEDALARFDPDAPDPRAKRLDYVFVAQPQLADARWEVARAQVGMLARHPRLHCSLSDHFSVETSLSLTSPSSAAQASAPGVDDDAPLLPPATYALIQDLTAAYIAREERQRVLRVGHFGAAVLVTIACCVGVGWAARVSAGAAVVLTVLASIGLAAGLLDGLIGGLFVAWEMSALREFAWEVAAARGRAEERETNRGS